MGRGRCVALLCGGVTGANLICLCEIAGPHGLKGEVKVKSFTADPGSIGDYGPLRDASGRVFTVVAAKPGPKGVIARFAEVHTREQAEALAGTALYVSRDVLPEADEDEWYHADLVGLRALGPDGEALGEIVGVLNFGAGDILELKREGAKQTALVPFNAETVLDVDIAGGVIRLALPDGWLE